MKCLSVCQPWAWAIVSGLKAIENRTWSTRYRGPLAIHVSRSRKYFQGRSAGPLFGGDEWLELPGLPHIDRLDFGTIVGTVQLLDCVPLPSVAGQRFAEGPWCWVLAHAVRIEPVPYRGTLGMFDVDDDLLKPLRQPSPVANMAAPARRTRS